MTLREALPRIAVESVLIVFTVLLALAVNEWREGRRQAQVVDRAIENVRNEIEHNKAEVEQTLPYHNELIEAVSDWMERDEPGGRAPVETLKELAPRGLFPPLLKDAAWESAVFTRTVNDFPYELVLTLSTVYEAQEEGVGSTVPRIVDVLMTRDGFDPSSDERSFLAVADFYINELAAQERSLLRLYEDALKHIDNR